MIKNNIIEGFIYVLLVQFRFICEIQQHYLNFLILNQNNNTLIRN